MVDILLDGTGTGNKAKVNSSNQLEVNAQSESLQHSQSSRNKEAYQVLSTINLSVGTITPIHIKNISKTKNLVATYIRHQIIDQSGGTSFPNASNYVSAAFARTRVSGGAALTPVNMFNGSRNTAEIEVYSEPTLTGTAKEFDRWYTKAEGDMNTWNKEGSLIIAPGNTLELSYIGDQSTGIIFARLSFIMKNINGD